MLGSNGVGLGGWGWKYLEEALLVVSRLLLYPWVVQTRDGRLSSGSISKMSVRQDI